MTSKQRARAEANFKAAMANLIGHPDFADFINILREQREIAIEDACTDSVIASQRTHMAAVGEIRAYKSIIAIYDEFIAQGSQLDDDEA